MLQIDDFVRLFQHRSARLSVTVFRAIPHSKHSVVSVRSRSFDVFYLGICVRSVINALWVSCGRSTEGYTPWFLLLPRKGHDGETQCERHKTGIRIA